MEFRRQLNALVDVVPTCCKLAEDFFTARREQQAAARPHKRTASPSACWALAVVSCAHVGTPGARPDRLPAWSRLPNCRAGAQAHERARARTRLGLGTTPRLSRVVSCYDNNSEENQDLSALSFARGTPHATELKRLCLPSSLGFLLTP